jgi:hypothetical protein
MIRLVRNAFGLIVLLVVLAAPAQGSAAEPKQWSFTPATTTAAVNGATPYAMTNDTGGSVGYGYRNFGADLVWGGSGRFSLLRKNVRDHRALKPGETVALYNSAAHKYLQRAYQTWGIDLDWTSAPKYEWKVVTGQTAEGNVRTALYNTTKGAYLVYQSRSYGINLGFQGAIAPGAAF